MENASACQNSPLGPVAPESIDPGCLTKQMNSTHGEDLTMGIKETDGTSPVLLSFIWFGMFLLAIAVSLAGQTMLSYQPYALSEFNAHSMISVIGTIQYILYVQVLYMLNYNLTADGSDMQLLGQL
jgi:hypothetical protein